MRPVQRAAPVLPLGAMKTYGMHMPKDAVRAASCAEVECLNLQHGWITDVDETSTLGQMQAHYIRRESGRAFVEDRTPDGLTRFTFEAGQDCFAEHRVVEERDPILLVRAGDWRGNPTGERRIHTRPEHWVEDMQQTLDSVRTGQERG